MLFATALMLLPCLLVSRAVASVSDDSRETVRQQIVRPGTNSPGTGPIRGPSHDIAGGPGIAYSVRSDFDGFLYSIDLMTATATPIGPTGYGDVEGLSFDANGVLYGYDDATEQLLICDVTTGACVPVGPSGIGVTDVGLSFDDLGDLYLATDIPGLLYRINPGTGGAVAVGPQLQYVNGLAFNNGVMYGLGGDFADNLVTINRATGAATPVGPLLAVSLVDGGIDFDDNGVLWGVEDAGALFTINTATGAATVVGNIGFGFESLAIPRTLNQDPDCRSAAPSIDTLWPPNHKLVEVEILGVTDADGDAVTITIDNITQDEPVEGTGDGDTCPDGVVAAGKAMLRAERSGNGNGRVYVISFTADDGHGGSCSGRVAVCVPHDLGGSTCENDGQNYSSLGPCTAAPPKGNGVLKAAPEPVLRTVGSTGPIASLEYSLAADGEIRLAVYDLMGRRVAVVESGARTAGTRRVAWNSGGLPSGMYFAVLQVGDRVVRSPVVLLK